MANNDTPIPIRNGWGEYQRLVLAELTRHNNLIEKLDEKLQGVSVEVRLLKEENHNIKEQQKEIRALQKQVSNIQQEDAVEVALRKYRRWIIAIIFTIIASGIIPIVRILVGL